MDEFQKRRISDIIEAHSNSGELHHAVHYTGSEVYWLKDSSGDIYYQWILLTSGEVAERHYEEPHCWWVWDADGRDVDKEMDSYFIDLCISVAEGVGCVM